jgi:hypothetical protein
MVSSKKTAFVSNPSIGMTLSQIRRRLRFSFHIHNVKDQDQQNPPKEDPESHRFNAPIRRAAGFSRGQFRIQEPFYSKG